MVVEYLEAFFGNNGIPLCNGEVFFDHFLNQLGECYFWLPTEFSSGLGGVAEQGFYLGRAEVAGIDAHDNITWLRAVF